MTRYDLEIFGNPSDYCVIGLLLFVAFHLIRKDEATMFTFDTNGRVA